MSDMPERIWADRNLYHKGYGEWLDYDYASSKAEYVRADLVAAKDAEIARLREALDDCGEARMGEDA